MSRIARRQMIVGATAVALANSTRRLSAATAPDWPKIAPADAGFAPDLEARLDDVVQTGRASNVHGILIARRGRMVAERYYEGDDQVRINDGKTEPGRIVFTAERRHELQVVAAEWLDQSFRPYVACDEQRRYGYFWYSGDFQYGNPPNRPIAHWVGAFGYGGQRLFVLPEFDIVVAITAGN